MRGDSNWLVVFVPFVILMAVVLITMGSGGPRKRK